MFVQESRLKDPSYYLRKQSRKTPRGDEYVETSASLTPRVDIDKDIKELRFHSKQKLPVSNGPSGVPRGKVTESVRMETMRSPAEANTNTPRYVKHGSYSSAYKKERQSIEKMYYALWRTAFNNALEKLRENKVFAHICFTSS